MIKTFLVSDIDFIRFQKTLNEFIKDKNIVNIQYQACALPGRSTVCDRALVVYKVKEEK